MGLLDSITSVLGEGGKNLKEQALTSALENMLGKGHPELGNILKNIDMSKAGDIMELIQKNGLPNSIDEIQKIIKNFSKPAAKK